MSSQEKVKTKDTLQITLRGPDGEIKDTRDSTRNFKWYQFLIAIILLIPYAIYRVLVPRKK